MKKYLLLALWCSVAGCEKKGACVWTTASGQVCNMEPAERCVHQEGDPILVPPVFSPALSCAEAGFPCSRSKNGLSTANHRAAPDGTCPP